MPAPHPIKRLVLSQFQQFDFCDLDFTHPVTGEVLNEVCLLGPNGSGKSAILSQIYDSIDSALLPLSTQPGATVDSLILTEFRIGDQNIYEAGSEAADAYNPGEFSWFSPGLQSYLLRIALVFCQYYNQPERRGFVFLDLPECGLSPELAISLVQFFQPNQTEHSGQLFIATHETKVTAQFEPPSLINLEFDEDTDYVYHERIEIEDRPQEKTEEIVEKEYDKAENNAPSTIQNRAAANRYSRLKRQIQDLENENKLADLVDEAFSIR